MTASALAPLSRLNRSGVRAEISGRNLFSVKWKFLKDDTEVPRRDQVLKQSESDQSDQFLQSAVETSIDSGNYEELLAEAETLQQAGKFPLGGEKFISMLRSIGSLEDDLAMGGLIPDLFALAPRLSNILGEGDGNINKDGDAFDADTYSRAYQTFLADAFNGDDRPPDKAASHPSKSDSESERHPPPPSLFPPISAARTQVTGISASETREQASVARSKATTSTLTGQRGSRARRKRSSLGRHHHHFAGAIPMSQMEQEVAKAQQEAASLGVAAPEDESKSALGTVPEQDSDFAPEDDRSDSPVIVWRPSARVRLATNLPPELRMYQSASKGLQALSESPAEAPHPRQSRSAPPLPPVDSSFGYVRRKPSKPIKYGSWFVDPALWGEMAQKAKAERAAQIAAENGSSDQGGSADPAAPAVPTEQTIATLYSSRIYKQFLRRHNYRIPPYLERAESPPVPSMGPRSTRSLTTSVRKPSSPRSHGT